MKIRKLGALLLSLALALGLLSGCGGGNEAEVTAADFTCCWEYADYDMWVCFYDDGTYEWYDSEGLEVMGNYYMSGDELWLEDSGMSFTLDGSGGLVDAFGDTLFLSELPQW